MKQFLNHDFAKQIWARLQAFQVTRLSRVKYGLKIASVHLLVQLSRFREERKLEREDRTQHPGHFLFVIHSVVSVYSCTYIHTYIHAVKVHVSSKSSLGQKIKRISEEGSRGAEWCMGTSVGTGMFMNQGEEFELEAIPFPFF